MIRNTSQLEKAGVEAGPNRAIERITEMWERVLHRTDIGAHDNFFDMGGEPNRAAELFSEISSVYGLTLPPVTICYAPTITDLAALLENPAREALPPLVGLKTGGGNPPIFMTHGLDASVLDFFPLVKRIQTDRAIYGLQATGADGIKEPLDSVEDMAEYFLGAMRQMQPSGPYLLIGYSLGGLVMLEIAQRLLATGEEVAMLTMVESYPHRRRLSGLERMRLGARLAGHHASTLVRLPLGDVRSYVFDAAQRRVLSDRRRGESGDAQPTEEVLDPGMQRLHDSSVRAWELYQPRRYKGKIRFVRATESDWFFPKNARAVWRHLAAEIEIETVPGDHTGVLTKHFDTLGFVLSRWLREAGVEWNGLAEQASASTQTLG